MIIIRILVNKINGTLRYEWHYRSNGLSHKIEGMSRCDHSFESDENHLIKQTNGFACSDIQGIPTENERAGVLPFYY